MKFFLAILFLTSLTSYAQQKSKAGKPPVNPLAIQLNNSACKAYGENNKQEAIRLLEEAIKVDSNCFVCYSNLVIYRNSYQLDWKSTLSLTKQMIRIRPKMAELYASAGVVCIKTGDSVSGDAYFKEALQIENSFLDTMKQTSKGYTERMSTKAECLILLNEHEKANLVLTEAIAVENRDWFKEYLTSMMSKSKKDLLEMDSQKEKKKATTTPLQMKCDSLNGLADVYENLMKDPEKALECYAKAIELSPTYATSFSNRGNLYAKLGRYDEACRDLINAKTLGSATADEALENLEKNKGSKCK